jgi:antitoxin component HigA of HigAB toxin-antitoxin module
MDIRPIRTKADCKAALKEISALMDLDPGPGTPEGDRLDVLATLVQAVDEVLNCKRPLTLAMIRRLHPSGD